jgi:hypothetical protein
MTSDSFKFAVDGKQLVTYGINETFPRRLEQPNEFNSSHPVFDRLTGMKIFATDGMNVCVKELRHVKLKETCMFYEKLATE